MGDIGPAQQRYEVLPVREPAEPARREPAAGSDVPQPPVRTTEPVTTR